MCTLLLMLLGCYPEITEVERRQHALESEVETLEAEVAQLTAALRAAGVKLDAPSAQRARRRGQRRGKPSREPTSDALHQDVSDALGARFARSGQPGPIPVPEVMPLQQPCAHKALVPSLKRISDYQLTQRGLGKASPLRMRLGEVELPAHAFPRQFESCGGAFRHAGTVVLFSTVAAGDPAEPVLFFDPAFPSQRADGKPVYWVHPGQEAQLVTSEPWDPSWGAPELVLTWDAARPPVITVDGRAAQPGSLQGQGPWRIGIEAQDHTLLQTVQIRSDSHGIDALRTQP